MRAVSIAKGAAVMMKLATGEIFEKWRFFCPISAVGGHIDMEDQSAVFFLCLPIKWLSSCSGTMSMHPTTGVVR